MDFVEVNCCAFWRKTAIAAENEYFGDQKFSVKSDKLQKCFDELIIFPWNFEEVTQAAMTVRWFGF